VENPLLTVRHPDRWQIHRVCTTEMHASMLAFCKQRQDQWAFDALSRLETCGDLFAADAVYHRNCWRAFSKVRSVSSLSLENTSAAASHRPVNTGLQTHFECL
jgi:hypothetical protein